MLDQDTKRKIDSARDILVGKVPDPKAQVEQITIALIYKFMDDMDKEAEELGGKAKFFTRDFKKYSWSNIMDVKIGAQEKLNLYAEGIEKMDHNKKAPQLFRDIFKNAYLPYRSPETLSLFLKTINEFSYDDSENLGDAFEYLVSILGTQKGAGQFRTPRHIIDFINEVVDPKKDETILDPACGTAGFLISAYKHILKSNTDKKSGDKLTPADRTKLTNNVVGYDIDPTMVKISLANLYLHNFKNPKIYEYDTLSRDDRWNETFDVILANPPFMTPKGGIRPHKRFSVKANRSEVLFVDYIMEHLNQKGRAGIIIPEGVLFKLDNAYKQLRKKLVEDGLFAVVSLPAGVFNPYAGVKTSILFFDNALAKKAKDVLFIRIENDGYDLGAQRNKLDDEGELPIAIHYLNLWQDTLKAGGSKVKIKGKKEWDHVIWVDKERIKENGDYNLTSERYNNFETSKRQKWSLVELGEIIDYEQPTKYIVKSTNYSDKYNIPVLTAGKTFILGYTNEQDGVFKDKLPVIIFDDFTTATKFVDFPFKVKSSAMKILHVKPEMADPKFLFYIMQGIKFNNGKHKRYWISEYSKIKVSLPPLDVQEKIIEEINGYQRIVDGARQIVENWKPNIKIDIKWKKVKLGDICEFKNGKAHEEFIDDNGKYIVVNSKFISSNGKIKKYSDKPLSPLLTGDVAMVMSDVPNGKAIAKCFMIDKDETYTLNQRIGLFRPKNPKLLNRSFLYLQLNRNSYLLNFDNHQSQTNLRKNEILECPFYLPNIEVQEKIVDLIKKEKEIVKQNNTLISVYEQKIKFIYE